MPATMADTAKPTAKPTAQGAPGRPGAPSTASLLDRFTAFVAERHPFAAFPCRSAMKEALGPAVERQDQGWEAKDLLALRPELSRALEARLGMSVLLTTNSARLGELPETTPGVSAEDRLTRAAADVADDCDGFLVREAVRASLSADERREMLWGMTVTRAQ